jgi:hypothetical protein
MNRHLLKNEHNDLLLGDATPAAHQHLIECAECRAAHEILKASITEFGAAARAWRPTTVPVTARPLIWPAWALVAAMLIVILALPVSIRQREQHRAAAKARIAQDNILLARIDSDVYETTPAPMAPLQ